MLCVCGRWRRLCVCVCVWHHVLSSIRTFSRNRNELWICGISFDGHDAWECNSNRVCGRSGCNCVSVCGCGRSSGCLDSLVYLTLCACEHANVSVWMWHQLEIPNEMPSCHYHHHRVGAAIAIAWASLPSSSASLSLLLAVSASSDDANDAHSNSWCHLYAMSAQRGQKQIKWKIR